MSRHDEERLHDILDAIRAIRKHLERGDLSDGLIYDAVRMRLVEIGEAVKDIDTHHALHHDEVGTDLRRCPPHLSHDRGA